MRNQSRLYDCLVECKIDEIKVIIQSHFTSIPGEWYRKNKIGKYEGYYCSVFYSYFASLGLSIKCEDMTNHGRIDMTVVMNHAVFIFEFKTTTGNKDKDKAIKQIKEKNYAEKCKGLNLPIYLIGLILTRQRGMLVFLNGKKTVS